MIAAALRYEWMRWRARRSSWILAAFFAAGTVLSAFGLHAAGRSGLVGGGSEPGGYAPAFHAAQIMLRLLGAFALAWGAFAVAPELAGGRHRMPLLRMSRTAFFAGKVCFLALVTGLFELLILAASLASGAALGGLRGIQIAGLPVYSSGELLAAGVIATLLTALPLLALVTLGASVSSSARSGETALIAAFMLAAALWGVSLFPGCAPFIFLARSGWPFSVAVSHGEGLRTSSFAGALIPFLVVNLAWTAAAGAAGLIVFRKRDLP